MSVVSYKCPNCNASLVFDPKSQRFLCQYCMSYFTESEHEAQPPHSQAVAEVADEEQVSEKQRQTVAEVADEEQVSKTQPQTVVKDKDLDQTAVFSCPSCGAEVVTDETTAATECYFCHNPVVLSGRLEGDFLPDKVIPFVIEKEQAVKTFLNWTSKKWFIPKDFFNKKQIEKITGVYFPYWMVDGQLHGKVDAKANQVRSWTSGDTRYTETKFYDVMREGDMWFSDIPRNALNKENSKLVEGVHPFKIQDIQDFSPAYLSGFQAEKRNIEKQALEDGVIKSIRSYAKDLLQDSIKGYSSVSLHHYGMTPANLEWKYTLLPVWVLTYKGKNGQIYYYTMNGQSGKISGVLPIHYRRLFLFFGLVSLLIALILLIVGYLL